MREGFVPGAGDVARWIAGRPEMGFMGTTKIEGKEQHSIQTFRCSQCGYLESYAPGK